MNKLMLTLYIYLFVLFLYIDNYVNKIFKCLRTLTYGSRRVYFSLSNQADCEVWKSDVPLMKRRRRR